MSDEASFTSLISKLPAEFFPELVDSVPLITDKLTQEIVARMALGDGTLDLEHWGKGERARVLFRAHRLERLRLVKSEWVGSGNPRHERQYKLTAIGWAVVKALGLTPRNE